MCSFGGGEEAPVYLSQNDLRRNNFRIRMIDDITCGIMGGIKSTVRPSIHADPYYDYNLVIEKDEAPFISEHNIMVMEVDTCPNALPMDTSEYFGKMLTEHVFTPLLEGFHSDVVKRSTIIKKGVSTERFSYLKDFAGGR